jgi:hypothetical protein
MTAHCKRPVPTYDVRCHDLAAVFLEDHPDLNTDAGRAQLARHIQGEIESEIDWMTTHGVTNR